MGKKILIVDDDKELADNIAKALTSNQYSVVEAHNSTDGLKKLLEEKPDLMILDVMMEKPTLPVLRYLTRYETTGRHQDIRSLRKFR